MRVNVQDEEGVEVQMAPLLDCMFLLLIFFLVATTMKKIVRQLDLTLPVADAAVKVPENPDTLVLSVDRNGQFYVNGVEAGREKILSMVEEAHKKGRLVRLDGDADARYQYIVELVSLCRMRGVNSVKLNLRDPNKPGP